MPLWAILESRSKHSMEVDYLNIEIKYWKGISVPKSWKVFTLLAKHPISQCGCSDMRREEDGRFGQEVESQLPSFYCSASKLGLTLCDPMDCSTPGSLPSTVSQSLLKFMSIEPVIESVIHFLSYIYIYIHIYIYIPSILNTTPTPHPCSILPI